MTEGDELQAAGRELDHRIMALTLDKAVPPMVKLAFDGALGTADIEHLAERIPPGDPSAMKKSPLEYMYEQARDRLEEWEYLAGVRFRRDFDLAHMMSTGVANIGRAEMFDTALSRQHRARGYAGRGAARQVGLADMSHARIDAMQRRGAFAAANRTSWWLAEAIVGWELWPKEVAAYLGEDPRFIGRRFREALHDLAGFYRIHVKACPRPRGIKSVMYGDKPTMDAWSGRQSNGESRQRRSEDGQVGTPRDDQAAASDRLEAQEAGS